MATTAQIEANRRNARKSTGPKTDAGKAVSRLNALRHGRRAKPVPPVLPEPDPAELERRIHQWVRDLKPGDAAERTLVERAARTALELEGLDRHEADRRARRREEARGRRDDEAARRACDLGRKLLAMTPADRRKPAAAGPARDDDPEATLRELEGSAAGCRWLLGRWAGLKHMFDRGDSWTVADLYRSIRLQGKEPLEAINDPELNLWLVAWEVYAGGGVPDFWRRCRDLTPLGDPGFNEYMKWRELVDRPADKEAAVAAIEGVIDGRVARLEAMLALYEEVADEEAAAGAWFDPGPEGEGVRRRQAALARELRQFLELILRMQAARRKRTDPDEPRSRGGRGEEEGRPDEIRETTTAEGTDEGRSTEIGQDARAGSERTERKPARRAGARKPVVLPGEPERFAEDGLTDEVRALARAMSGGRPDLPLSVTGGATGETNGPNLGKPEIVLWQEDKPRDPGTSGDDRSR